MLTMETQSFEMLPLECLIECAPLPPFRCLLRRLTYPAISQNLWLALST